MSFDVGSFLGGAIGATGAIGVAVWLERKRNVDLRRLGAEQIRQTLGNLTIVLKREVIAPRSNKDETLDKIIECLYNIISRTVEYSLLRVRDKSWHKRISELCQKLDQQVVKISKSYNQTNKISISDIETLDSLCEEFMDVILEKGS